LLEISALNAQAHVRDGYQPQTNIARLDGKLGGVKSALPQGLNLVTLNDQSVYVRAAISGSSVRASSRRC
jgi:hypothetical protein